MLKWAIQDLWDASDLRKKNAWCTSRGPHVLKLANVTTNPCLMGPYYISHAIKLRAPYAYCSLDKGVAFTGGGGAQCSHDPPENPTTGGSICPQGNNSRFRQQSSIFSVTRAVLNGKKNPSGTWLFQKRPRVAHMFNHGWWRLAVGGWWRLPVAGCRLVVGGGWRRLAAVTAVGSW